MSYANVKNSRARLKERIIYVMGEKCQCCGYNKCNTALELHHLDPKEKDFSIGSNTNNRWQNVRNEIQKCILVCANCHREIHYGLIDNNLLSPSFLEDRAKEIDELINNLKTHKISYCKFCGKEVWASNDCCKECSDMQRRVVERPTREILKEKIRTESFLAISREYGVSDNAIRKWCKKYNLPSKKAIIKSYSDVEWELI